MKQDALKIVGRAIGSCRRAHQSEACLISTFTGLTRFADNCIHQNVSHQDRVLKVRVALGQRVGQATTNRLVPAQITRCCQKAMDSARAGIPDPDFPGFPARAGRLVISRFDNDTYSCSPAKRARLVKEFVGQLSGRHASGALETTVTEIALANSQGIQTWGRFSWVILNSVVEDQGLTTWVSSAKRAVQGINCRGLARSAVKRLKISGCLTIEPGQYDVVLEPEAVATLVDFLGYLGFGAKAYQEGRSFLKRRLGAKVASESITLWDDARHRASLGPLFDREGVLKEKVVLIEKGIAKGMVHDSKTGAKGGVSSTGHAAYFDGGYGPIPVNLVMAPGKDSPSAMVRDMKRGLLVSRFHYTNVVDFRNTLITGMTRDGTYLIEKGRPVARVNDLRFTQNILDALKKVQAISRQRKSVSDGFGSCVVPAIKIRQFNFTSTSPA